MTDRDVGPLPDGFDAWKTRLMDRVGHRVQEIYDAITDADILDHLLVSPKARGIAQEVLAETWSDIDARDAHMMAFINDQQRQTLCEQIVSARLELGEDGP